jgi:hypothetical protein
MTKFWTVCNFISYLSGQWSQINDERTDNKQEIIPSLVVRYSQQNEDFRALQPLCIEIYLSILAGYPSSDGNPDHVWRKDHHPRGYCKKFSYEFDCTGAQSTS